MVHYMEGRAFFADKEDILSPGDEIGDEIGDRLAFARPGWSLDDIAVSCPALQDRLCLSGVGSDDMKPVVGPVAVKGMLGKDPGFVAKKCVEAMVLQLSVDDHIIFPDTALLLVIEITQHHLPVFEVPGV